MTYAEGTSVSVEKSRAEIEACVRRHGADQFVSGWAEDGRAMIQFRCTGRYIRFILSLPDPKSEAFTKTPGRKWTRPPEEATKVWEQACRARWRALCLCIKAKLEAVAVGITTFEIEFMPHTLMPDGKSVAEHVLPGIENAYKNGKMLPLLPHVK